MRGSIAVLAMLGTACTVDRIFPPGEFACLDGDCDSGVTRRDGGVVTPPRDGGVDQDRDAGIGMDVPRVDTGVVPLADCPGILPIPATGVAIGSTTDANNGYEGGCGPNGGKDVVYGFTVPGRLWYLDVTTAGTAYDTVVHFYEGDCTRPSQRVCADETDTELMYAPQASFRLEDVPPGAYAAIVDSFTADMSGDYVLRVKGAVAPGETCDPDQTYLGCLIGSCTVEGDGVPRCPAVLDCLDGIDADRDGMTDEDAAQCNAPPTVTCSPGATALLDRPTMPSASVTDNGTIVFREWAAMTLPVGSWSEPIPRDQDGTSLLLDIDGTYGIRYVAADDAFQLSACELNIQTIATAGLRAELIWSPQKPRFASTELMFLHLLAPLANRWFHPDLSCSGPPCFDMPPDWGQQGDISDDPLWVGFFYGPQRIYVDAPITSGRYAYGVHLIDLGGQPSVEATLRIFCDGTLVQEYGPTTLTNGNFETQDMNDFWKVAEISMNANGTCDVFPFGNGTNAIVRASDAMNSR